MPIAKATHSPAKSKQQPLPGPVMIDVLGESLTLEDKTRLANPLVGGIILFGRNFVNRKQLLNLNQEIKTIRPDILIAIDHEGGRVQRCKTDGFTHLPAMRRLGEIWQKDVLASLRLATHCGYLLATELRACGVDFSFTPVLDIDFGASSVIGNRAFDSDPRNVTLLAKALNEGLLLAGMANCGKHFPGHGFVAADSHVAMPVDERPFDVIWNTDMLPYQYLGNSLRAIMPAHVVYPNVDPHNPAGFSKKWLQTVLREKIGFNGVIFSDDMSMEGARAGGDIVSGAQKAFAAGVDMVLVCNRPDLADDLLLGLTQKKFKHNRLSQQRILSLMPQTKALDWKTLSKSPDYLAAKADLTMFKLINA